MCSERVAFLFLLIQVRIDRVEGRLESILIDEGKESDTHPSSSFAVQIDPEGGRVEVDDRRVRVLHQQLPRLRQILARSSREDRHQLFQRFERLGFTVEENVHLLNVLEIRRERSIVEWIEPLPVRTSLVVIQQNPGQSSNILLHHLFTHIPVHSTVKLPEVIPFFPPFFSQRNFVFRLIV